MSAEATGTGREALTLALFRCPELRAALAFGCPQEAWEDCRQGIATAIEGSDWLAAVVAQAERRCRCAARIAVGTGAVGVGGTGVDAGREVAFRVALVPALLRAP